MTREIDCRGLACPAPVLQTKEALEKDQPNLIKVVVDNEASKQNVSRFMESQNLEVTVLQDGADFHVIGRIGEHASAEDPVEERPEPEHKKIMDYCRNREKEVNNKTAERARGMR